MNQEIKKRWVAALRSGEYKQGQGKLKNGDKFCCLGVLSDLFSKERQCEFPIYNNTDLDNSVVVWAGLEDNSPKIDGVHLADYNDHDISFSKIADLIGEQL